MAAPAARSPATRRSATAPPPTTRQRRPASSRHTGKWATSAIDPVRRAPGRLVARDRLDELAGEEPAQVVIGVARGEMPEGLARQTVGQEGAQQPLDCREDVRRGQAEPDRAGDRLVEADGAADAEVVGVHERAVHLDLLPLDAEVGDPVLAAAVGAAGDVDPEVLLEAGQSRLERLDQAPRKALRLRERQLAELRARAGDRAATEGRGVEAQARRLESAAQGRSVLAPHVGDQEVLHARRPEFARAVAVGEVGGRAHLRRREPPAPHGHARVDVTRLLLRVDPDVVAVDVVGRVVAHAGRQRHTEPFLDRAEEPCRREAVLQEQELEPRLLAVLAEGVRVAEDLGDRAQHRKRLMPGDERVEGQRQVRVGREATPDAHGEPDLARARVTLSREADVVDLGVRAPRAAAGDRHLVLARQVVEGRVAVEHPRRRVDEGRGVHELVCIRASERAAGDVPRDVAARAERRDAVEPERLEHGGEVLERDPVELDVLADRDVGDPARVTLGEVGNRAELMGVERAVRDADAHHDVERRLALAPLAADGADAVALRVDPPPAEVGAEPWGRDRVPALTREADDVVVRRPRVQLPLEALDALRLGLLHRFAHGVLPKWESREAGARLARPPGFRLRVATFAVTTALRHPTYRSGTSTQALQRAHFALTRPVGASTFRTALRMTTSPGSCSTTLARHTGQRATVTATEFIADSLKRKYYCLSGLSRTSLSFIL